MGNSLRHHLEFLVCCLSKILSVVFLYNMCIILAHKDSSENKENLHLALQSLFFCICKQDLIIHLSPDVECLNVNGSWPNGKDLTYKAIRSFSLIFKLFSNPPYHRPQQICHSGTSLRIVILSNPGPPLVAIPPPYSIWTSTAMATLSTSSPHSALCCQDQ